VFSHDWTSFSHSHQEPPPGPWTSWLLIGGRGAGKTFAGAKWVKGMAQGEWPYAAAMTSPIALIGETEHDVREVMIEGVSGIMAAHARRDRPTWIPSRRRLEWSSGAVAQAFSADDPESLRGPQFAAAWIDEIAKWR
jgi:phage terminase large subunit-like protein